MHCMQTAISKVENSAQVSSCQLKFVHDWAKDEIWPVNGIIKILAPKSRFKFPAFFCEKWFSDPVRSFNLIRTELKFKKVKNETFRTLFLSPRFQS